MVNHVLTAFTSQGLKPQLLRTQQKNNGIFVKKSLGSTRPVPIGRVGLPETQDFFFKASLQIYIVDRESSLWLIVYNTVLQTPTFPHFGGILYNCVTIHIHYFDVLFQNCCTVEFIMFIIDVTKFIIAVWYFIVLLHKSLFWV